MSQSHSIAFVLRGQADGVEITPRSIGISLFNQFNAEVESLVGGTEKLGIEECHVQVQEGSYELLVNLSPVAFGSLSQDIEFLKNEDTLGDIDPRRAEVIAKWQSRARSSSSSANFSYEIRPKTKGLPHVRITKETDFHVGNVAPWVTIEKYLYGQIVDMGGANRANVHLRLLDTNKIIRVDTTQSFLQKQSANRLYHKALLHVRAEQHHKTGAIRKYELIGFAEYDPKYDENALDRFAAAGKNAWRDVPDGNQWLSELRGGK